eukprot:ctg_526.g297
MSYSAAVNVVRRRWRRSWSSAAFAWCACRPPAVCWWRSSGSPCTARAATERRKKSVTREGLHKSMPRRQACSSYPRARSRFTSWASPETSPPSAGTPGSATSSSALWPGACRRLAWCSRDIRRCSRSAASGQCLEAARANQRRRQNPVLLLLQLDHPLADILGRAKVHHPLDTHRVAYHAHRRAGVGIRHHQHFKQVRPTSLGPVNTASTTVGSDWAGAVVADGAPTPGNPMAAEAAGDLVSVDAPGMSLERRKGSCLVRSSECPRERMGCRRVQEPQTRRNAREENAALAGFSVRRFDSGAGGARGGMDENLTEAFRHHGCEAT